MNSLEYSKSTDPFRLRSEWIIVALAAGAGMALYPVETAILVALGAVTSLVWYSPDHATKVILAMLLVMPFLEVTPVLRPGQVSYGAYFAILVLPVCMVHLVRSPRLTLDSGTVFLLLVLASSGLTLLASAGIRSAYGLLLWPLTTLSVYLTLLHSEKNMLKWFVRLVMVFAVVEAVLGICQSLAGWPVFSFASPTIYETNRGVLGYVLPEFSSLVRNGSGTFAHFNGLGGLLALALPISFGAVLSDHRRVRSLFPFVILAAGLLSTYSRGGLVGATIGCLLAFCVSRPRAWRILMPLLTALTVMITILAITYLASYWNATQNVTTRSETWRYAITYWIERPESMPFGLGFGSFQATILPARLVSGGAVLTALHASVLQVLLELGVVGLIALVWLLLTTVQRFSGHWTPGWQTWTLCGIAAFVVAECFDNALFGLVGTCAFGLCACLRRSDLWRLEG